MNNVLYFDSQQQINSCLIKAYKKFIDYAFERTDYFMLVFVDYYGQGYSSSMEHFEKTLEPYKVMSRTNPSWPGTPETKAANTTYSVNFYKTNKRAKLILKEVEYFNDWSRPNNPQDLAFFVGNKCWFYSVGHEKISAIINPNKQDLDFLSSVGLHIEPLKCIDFEVWTEKITQGDANNQ